MSPDPKSADIVIREIARLKGLIESDPRATPEQREGLLQRLDVEHQSYLAWLQRYASYFRNQRAWKLELAPMPSQKRQREEQSLASFSGERPGVEVFADFGGFTHRITYPKGLTRTSDPRGSIESMIPGSVYEFMEEWTSEFHRHAWDDAMRGKHGTMLWVPFDIQGMSIARAIKLNVGEAARVFYLKPSEDPFACYDYARELLMNGEVPSDEFRSPGLPQEYRSEPIDLSLLKPDPGSVREPVRLTVQNRVLYFPRGGTNYDASPVKYDDADTPALLVRYYDTGDCDTIPWPIPADDRDDHLRNLAHALYGERKSNPFYSANALIELPDGSVFDVVKHLAE